MNQEQLGKHIIQYFRLAAYQTGVFNKSIYKGLSVQQHTFSTQAWSSNVTFENLSWIKDSRKNILCVTIILFSSMLVLIAKLKTHIILTVLRLSIKSFYFFDILMHSVFTWRNHQSAVSKNLNLLPRRHLCITFVSDTELAFLYKHIQN